MGERVRVGCDTNSQGVVLSLKGFHSAVKQCWRHMEMANTKTG